MDKLTAIKIKYDDGTYSDEIPVSVLSENVEWDSTHTLVDILGSINVDVTGTIQDQISQLFNEKVSTSVMQDYIANSMPKYITNWLDANVNPVGSAVTVDYSLSISGSAADAKITGQNFNSILKLEEYKENITNKIVWAENNKSIYSNGEPIASSGIKYSDYLDVHNYTGLTLMAVKSTTQTSTYGTAFYDSNKVKIAFIGAVYGSENGVIKRDIDFSSLNVNNIYYIRTNYRMEEDNFYILGWTENLLKETLDNITEDIKKINTSSNWNLDTIVSKTNLGSYRILKEEEWEQGTLTSQGPKDSTTRSRTIDYIPVKQGDQILLYPSYNNGTLVADNNINIWFYDKEKNFQSVSQWYQGQRNSIITIESDGYIKIHGSGNPSKFADRVIIYNNKENNNFYYSIIDENNIIDFSESILITDKMLIEGSITTTGDNPLNQQNIRYKTFNYIKVNKNDIINTSGNDNFQFNIFYYDLNKEYITNTGFINHPVVINNEYFIRISFRYTDNSVISNPSVFNNFISIDKNILSEKERFHYISSSIKDLNYGYISSSGIVTRQDRIYTMKYFPVSPGDILIINLKEVAYTVNIYNSDGERIDYTSWFINSPYYIVKHTGFIRLYFYRTDSENFDLEDQKYDKLITILYPFTNDEKNILFPCNTNILQKPKIKYTNLNIGQDGCIINNNLWMFMDGLSALGNINVIDINTGNILSTKTHQLGHANTVDFNISNNFLVSYVRGEQGYNHPAIGLYPNPQNKETLLPTDSGYIIIKLYNDDIMMSPSGGCCWGENNQIIYFMDGYYSDMTNLTKADKINIYKIQLGMGTNDLSNSGFGTYTEAADTEYNGTCKILKTYTGNIMDGVNTKNGSGYIGTVQGMEYDGYIYTAWGTAGHNFLKIELNDNDNTYKVIHNYMYHEYDTNYSEKFYEPELLALYNNKVICGSYSPTNGSLLLGFDK